MRRNSHPSTAGIVLFAAATMVSGLFFTHDVFAKELAKAEVREAMLRAAELTRFQAQVDVDAKALTQLLDDDLEYTHSNGELDSKTSFIESLTSGRRDYVSTTATIETVRIFGDVAIIRGKAKVTVADAGQSRDLDLGYTDVWLWKDQRWQMTAWRSARMPPPTAAADAAQPASYRGVYFYNFENAHFTVEGSKECWLIQGDMKKAELPSLDGSSPWGTATVTLKGTLGPKGSFGNLGACKHILKLVEIVEISNMKRRE